MFSSRVPADLTPNRLAAAIRARRARGGGLLDLTLTNPTQAGIPYPPGLLEPLASAEGASYRPEPFGLPSARAAVALGMGVAVSAERIVLTASTSEAYSLLFKLLCDPGDQVLVPVPSYPLFEHLSRLDAVATQPYRLEYHGRWMIDEHSVDASWTDRVRAVLAVSPNNPTGSVLADDEFEMLQSRCAEGGAALIVDEVFADYPFRPEATSRSHEPVASAFRRKEALTFRLGGLSKSAGLPQVKLGWIHVDGPDALVEPALERLEIICDTYLSVSTPVQVAAPELIARGAAVRAAILERVRRNHDALARATTQFPALELLSADGGWSAVLRLPATRPEEDVVLDLLMQADVLVHPGYFFDFPTEAFLVVSLLPPPDTFDEAVRRMMARIHD